jgi:hypothetical protein
MTVQSDEGVLDDVLCSLAAAQHDDAEAEERGVVPPEQHVDELIACGRLRIAPAADTLLTHGEQLLRYGVRHARESFDRPSG